MATFINPYGAGCACARAECTDDCSVYKRYKPEPKPITHGDQLRAMSDEELAAWIENFTYNVTTCPKDKCHLEPLDIGEPLDREECKKCWLQWLRQEAGRDGRTD